MLHKLSFADRSSKWLDNHLTFRACLVLAVLLGLGQALDLYSFDFLLGSGVFWQSPPADTAQLLIALRYFDAEPWHWPLTHISALGIPGGVSVSNVSLPLVALLGKALQPIFGKDVNFFGSYELISMVLQPVAMLWLLWEMGVRNRVSLLCGAVIALSFPIFLYRVGHVSLIGQYPITAALALYFVTKRRRGAAPWIAFIGLSLITMLIMLYLTIMVDGILFAAAVTDMLRAKRLRSTGAAALLIVIVVSIAMLWAAEYLSVGGGTFQGNGYGYYSMNLVSPIFPQDSTLFFTEGRVLDMTGGQYEGMSYLGAGLFLLLCGAAVILPAEFLSGRARLAILAAMRGNWVLLLVLSAFVVFAVSNEVYVGSAHFHFGLPISTDLPGNLRSSGRFFWPLGYALAAGLIWAVDRIMPPGKAGLILLLIAGLQYADASYLRSGVTEFSRTTRPMTLSREPWLRLVRAHGALAILPTFHCAAEQARGQIMDLLLYASDRPIPVNTMYTGRSTEDCVAGAETAHNAVLGDGALHVFFDEQFSWGAIKDLAGAAQLCRKFAGGHVCTAKWPALEREGPLPGLGAPGGRQYDIGQRVSLADPAVADFRGWGWWRAEAAGAWMIGSRSDLALDLAEPAIPDGLVFRFRGHASLLGATSRSLKLELDGTKLGEWIISDEADHDYTAPIPASKVSLELDFTMDAGKSQRDLHLHSDNRRLGFDLESFSLTTADP